MQRREGTDKAGALERIWFRGKCFKCNEPWVPGHNKVCKFTKHVHLITVEDEDEEFPEENTEEEVFHEAQSEPQKTDNLCQLSLWAFLV